MEGILRKQENNTNALKAVYACLLNHGDCPDLCGYAFSFVKYNVLKRLLEVPKTDSWQSWNELKCCTSLMLMCSNIPAKINSEKYLNSVVSPTDMSTLRTPWYRKWNERQMVILSNAFFASLKPINNKMKQKTNLNYEIAISN